MLMGHVDRLEREAVGGWAADPSRPEAPIDVVVFLNGQRYAQVPADRPREDLRDAGTWGDGKHGFRYVVPHPASQASGPPPRRPICRHGELVPGGDRLIQATTRSASDADPGYRRRAVWHHLADEPPRRQ